MKLNPSHAWHVMPDLDNRSHEIRYLLDRTTRYPVYPAEDKQLTRQENKNLQRLWSSISVLVHNLWLKVSGQAWERHGRGQRSKNVRMFDLTQGKSQRFASPAKGGRASTQLLGWMLSTSLTSLAARISWLQSSYTWSSGCKKILYMRNRGDENGYVCVCVFTH